MTYALSTDIHRSEKRFFDRWRIIKNECNTGVGNGMENQYSPDFFLFFFGVKITVCWVVIYRHTAYRHTLIVQVGTPIRCLVTPDSSGKKGGRNSQIIKKERERKRRRRGEEMKSIRGVLLLGKIIQNFQESITRSITWLIYLYFKKKDFYMG